MNDRDGGDDPGRREQSGEDTRDGSDGSRPRDPDRGSTASSGPGPRDEPDSEDEHRHETGDPADRTGAGRAGAEGNRQGGPRAGRRDDSSRIATEERRRNAPIVTGVAAIVGAWVALSGPLLAGATAALWNNVAVGLAILFAAGYNYSRLSDDAQLSVGVAALAALLGIWLVIAAPLLEMDAGAYWSTIASGLLVAGLAGYAAYEGREARAVTTDERSEPGRG